MRPGLRSPTSLPRPVWLAGAAVALASCAAPPPLPLIPAGASVELDHYAGTPLTGPLDIVVRPTPALECLPVRLRLVAVESVPYDVGFPLSAISDVIVRVEAARPVQANSLQVRGARAAGGAIAEELLSRLENGDWGETADVSDLWTALPGGVTAQLRLMVDTRVTVLDVYRVENPDGTPTDSLSFAIAAYPTESSTAGPEVPAHQPELIVLEPRLDRDQRTGIILLRSIFSEEGPRALAAIVQFGYIPDVGTENRVLFESAVARTYGDITRNAGIVAERLKGMGDTDPGHAQAWRELRAPTRRRAALAFLAAANDAPFAEDLALAGSDAALAQAVQTILETADELPPGTDIGWILERAIYTELFERFAEDDVSLGLQAALIRHTGSLARLPYLLENLVEESTSLQELQLQLVEWNTLALESRDPADRLRAYEWLGRNGDVPPDYDPLASLEECREAVRLWHEAEAQDEPPESEA